MNELDLLVFGDMAIDYFYEVGSFPKLNESVDVKTVHKFYGGMGANTAIIASNLGLQTGLVSVVGSDAEDYLSYMRNQGIKQHLKGIFGDTTKSIFFKNKDDQISFFYKGIAKKVDELKPDKELVDASRCIYMSRTYLNLQERVSKLCKEKFLTYNPGYGIFKFKNVPKKFYRILKRVDVLMLNRHEFEHMKSIGFKLDFKLGPSIFLITKGGDGCCIHSKNLYETIPVFKTKEMDTTGAGDAFNAGFITAHLKGFNTLDSVKIGNSTASFIVEKWGCQTNLPTWDQVMERYKKIK